jgi:hypothetical protein
MVRELAGRIGMHVPEDGYLMGAAWNDAQTVIANSCLDVATQYGALVNQRFRVDPVRVASRSGRLDSPVGADEVQRGRLRVGIRRSSGR